MSERQDDQQTLFAFEQDDTLLEHLGDLDINDPAYAGVLAHMHALLERVLQSHAGPADELPLALVVALCKEFGGIQLYFPRGRTLMAQIEQMKIWREFNGKNIKQLALKYGKCEITIYKIIAAQRAAEMRKRQGDLFVS